jgi:multidrug efflux system outer membrane protein
MKILQQLIYLIVVMFIVSCGLLGPKYSTPNIDKPTHFRSAQFTNSTNILISPDTKWWRKFNDQELNNLITAALKNNNNIQMAIANISVAQAQLKEVHMGWVPTLGLSANAIAGQSNVYNSSSNPEANMFSSATNSPNQFNLYQAGLSPSYSFNVFSLIAKGNLAKANLEMQQAAKDTVRLTVISQVVGGYFTLMAVAKQQQQQQQLIEHLTQLVRLNKQQYSDGYLALSEIQRYKMQLDQAKIDLANLQQNKMHTENALQVLLNKNPGAIALDRSINSFTTNGLVPANIPSSILRNRPDIRQAEGQLKLANADIGVATANFFPSLNITTPLGAFNTAFASLFNSSGNYWSTQIGINMPILNAGLTALIKEKKAKYYVAYYNYIQTVRQAFANVDNSFTTYNTLNRDALIVADMQATSLKDFNWTYNDYKVGYATYIDVLQTQLNLDQAEINQTQIKLQQFQALVGLYQELSGGYN